MERAAQLLSQLDAQSRSLELQSDRMSRMRAANARALKDLERPGGGCSIADLPPAPLLSTETAAACAVSREAACRVELRLLLARNQQRWRRHHQQQVLQKQQQHQQQPPVTPPQEPRTRTDALSVSYQNQKQQQQVQPQQQQVQPQQQQQSVGSVVVKNSASSSEDPLVSTVIPNRPTLPPAALNLPAAAPTATTTTTAAAAEAAPPTESTDLGQYMRASCSSSALSSLPDDDAGDIEDGAEFNAANAAAAAVAAAAAERQRCERELRDQESRLQRAQAALAAPPSNIVQSPPSSSQYQLHYYQQGTRQSSWQQQKQQQQPSSRFESAPSHSRHHQAWCRLTAIGRGFLVRRLMQSDRVQAIVRAIRDTAEFAVSLVRQRQLHSNGASGGGIVGTAAISDLALQERVVKSLRASLLELHDVFFALSRRRQLALIAATREARIEALRKRASVAASVEATMSAASTVTVASDADSPRQQRQIMLLAGDGSQQRQQQQPNPTSRMVSAATRKRMLARLQQQHQQQQAGRPNGDSRPATAAAALSTRKPQQHPSNQQQQNHHSNGRSGEESIPMVSSRPKTAPGAVAKVNNNSGGHSNKRDSANSSNRNNGKPVDSSYHGNSNANGLKNHTQQQQPVNHQLAAAVKRHMALDGHRRVTRLLAGGARSPTSPPGRRHQRSSGSTEEFSAYEAADSEGTGPAPVVYVKK